MRILVVQETDWIDRNPVLHHRMLESLSIAGHDIRVIDFEILWRQRGKRPVWQARRTVEQCHRFFPDARVTVIRPAMLRLPGLDRPSWLTMNWRELHVQFEAWRPDVVVAYSISNAYLAMRLARRHAVPFVYHLIDALHTLAEPQALRPVARLVERAVLRRADRIIVVNNRLRDYAVEEGADPAIIDIIPMGADIRSGEQPDGERVRRELAIDPEDVVLLFMGWLYPFSGIEELTRAIARRRSEFPQLKLLVVGDGDLLPELQRLRGQLGLEQHLILTGRRPRGEMRSFIAAADICLLPAHRNATMANIVPAKVLEYMEQGKPVIATRLPGLQAEFGDLTGLVYIDQPEEVLDQVARLRTLNPGCPRQLAKHMGSSCRAFMQGRESWELVTSRFADVLHRARAGAAPLRRPASRQAGSVTDLP